MSGISACLECTYSLDADNLASGLLDLSQTAQEVPETGLRDRGVGSEDRHAVHGGSRGSLGGQMAPDDLVFLKTTCNSHISVRSEIRGSFNASKSIGVARMLVIETVSASANVVDFQCDRTMMVFLHVKLS